jgi:uncharacterized YccA/Bax inhibitor family protein
MPNTAVQPTMGRTYDRMYSAFPQSVATRPFTATGVYDKVLILFVLAVATGIGGYLFATSAAAVVAIIVAFATSMIGIFVPRLAKFTAPVYALTEGFALGWISARYSDIRHDIVPLSILITGAIFFAALFLFRTGLVKVTHRFVTMTIMATAGLAAVFILALFGISLPGVNDLGSRGIIFGVIGLVIAVMNLFVDFQFIQQMADGTAAPMRPRLRRGIGNSAWPTQAPVMLSSDAEWYAAQSLMLALVLVYLSILRILASSAGGRRS